MGLCVEDEIELPVFNNVDDSSHYPFMDTVLDSDEEITAHRRELVSICPSDDENISEEEVWPQISSKSLDKFEITQP